jgi:putative FmdB family regulatory protein
MPTYEYECTRCGHVCEEFKPISAPRRQRCPECRGKVERLVSGGLGVVFKGSGFYINDSRGKNKPAQPTGAAGSADTATPAAKSGDSPTPKKSDAGGSDS